MRNVGICRKCGLVMNIQARVRPSGRSVAWTCNQCFAGRLHPDAAARTCQVDAMERMSAWAVQAATAWLVHRQEARNG